MNRFFFYLLMKVLKETGNFECSVHVIISLPLSLYFLRQGLSLRLESSEDPPASAWSALGLQHAVLLYWLCVHAGDAEVKLSCVCRKHSPHWAISPAQPPSSCFTFFLILPKQMATNLTLRKVFFLLSHSSIDLSLKWVSAGSIKEIVDVCTYWSLWEESAVNCSGRWHEVHLPVGCQWHCLVFRGFYSALYPSPSFLATSEEFQVSSMFWILPLPILFWRTLKHLDNLG